MQKLSIDFNNSVGNIVLDPLRGKNVVVGEVVAVCDLDTDTYEATVVSIENNTVALKVDFTTILEEV